MLRAYLLAKNEVLMLRTSIDEEASRLNLSVSGALSGTLALSSSGTILKVETTYAPSKPILLDLAIILRSCGHLLVTGDIFISVDSSKIVVWKTQINSTKIDSKCVLSLDEANLIDGDDLLGNLAILVAVN